MSGVSLNQCGWIERSDPPDSWVMDLDQGTGFESDRFLGSSNACQHLLRYLSLEIIVWNDAAYCYALS